MVAGDPRRGQRGDTQRSRQKLVTGLRRRQRIRPQQCPEPWAWYRSDDIAHFGDGGQVTDWPDRVGPRDLVDAEFTSQPTFYADAIDGHGVQANVDKTGTARMQVLYDDYPFPDGITVALVTEYLHEDPEFDPAEQGDSGQFYIGGPVDVRVLVEGGTLRFNAFGPDARFEMPFPGTANRFHALLGVMSNAMTRLWLDGVELTNPDVHAVGDWSSAVGSSLYQQMWHPDNGFTEMTVWDQPLSDGCVAQQHAYLAGRYPSLGI